MEKLGIANADLLKELRSEYRALREEEAKHIKLGSSLDLRVILKREADAIKARIDELETKDGSSCA